MNKNLKVIMIVLVVMIIIIMITLGILLNKMEDVIIEAEEKNTPSTDEYNTYYNELTKTYQKYEYFDIHTCVNIYINTLKTLNEKAYAHTIKDENSKLELDIYIKEQEKKLYDLLGEEYIEQSNITVDNIKDTFLKYYEIDMFNINDMRGIDIDTNLSIYVIDGQILYNDLTTEEYQLIVKKDAANLTFAIYPYQYIKENGSIDKTIEELKQSKDSMIKNKYTNLYYSQAYDDEYICKYYFNIFKRNIISNPGYIYNKLNKEYKEKRFPKFEDFENYIKEKQIENMYIQMKQYLVEKNNNTIEYVCKDQYGDLYIFKQSSIGDYTLILDTYTLEQPKFNQEYEKATNQKKVMMNIDKFFQMINAKDYKAAYSVLDDTFKNNYFKTEEDFKNYMKQRVFSYNDIEYVNYEGEISSIYKYDLTLKNRLDNTQETNFSIIMQLKEGTDFVMSFNVQ